MVNFVDTFTKMYGRKPTESEAAFMMRMRAERDARLNKDMSPKEGLLVASQRSQYHAKKAIAERNSKTAVNVPARAFTVNKLIGFGLTNEQIAEALGLEMRQVERNINRYRLPRQDIQKRVW